MKALASFAVLAMSAAFAHAADLSPLKAPAYKAPVCTPGAPATTTMGAVLPSCSGFYGGFSVQGLGSNLDILGSGINNSVFAGGGVIGLVGGYQFWNGQFFLAGEANCGLNIQTNSLNGAIGNRNWDCNVLAKAGVGLSGILGIGQPNAAGQGTPSQGINLAIIPGSALMSPYFVLGDSFKASMSGGWTAGAGTEFILAQGWNLDIYYHRINWNGTQTAVIPGAAVSSTQAENRVGFAFLKMF